MDRELTADRERRRRKHVVAELGQLLQRVTPLVAVAQGPEFASRLEFEVEGQLPDIVVLASLVDDQLPRKIEVERLGYDPAGARKVP